MRRRLALFGRVRSEARIRARVAPVKPRAKEERRDRKTKAGPQPKLLRLAHPQRSQIPSREAAATKPKRTRSTAAPKSAVATETVAPDADAAEARAASPPCTRAPVPPREPRPPREASAMPSQDVTDAGEKFLNGLVQRIWPFRNSEHAQLSQTASPSFESSGADLGVMIGPKAQTLTAIQDLLRTVVYYQVDGDAGRLCCSMSGVTVSERRRQRIGRVHQEGRCGRVLASGAVTGARAYEPGRSKSMFTTPPVRSTELSRSHEGEDAARRVVLSLG